MAESNVHVSSLSSPEQQERGSESDDSTQDVGVFCKCKSTCQRKGKCPCKSAGVNCGELCSCGTSKKPCKNRPTTETGSSPSSHTVTSTRDNRITELQEYVATLTTEQCHKLILEAYSQIGGMNFAKALIEGGPNEPPHGDNNLPWCICGRCRAMPTPQENVCCRNRSCISTTEMFETIVLNRDVISVAIVHRADVYSDESRYEPSDYRKAAYRQWTMWRCGYLGRANRRVIPACVVWAVRGKYPAPDGNYLGFKEY